MILKTKHNGGEITNKYPCINTNLRSYGLEPILLSNKTIASLIQLALKYKHRVNVKLISPQVQWKLDNQEKETIIGN